MTFFKEQQINLLSIFITLLYLVSNFSLFKNKIKIYNNIIFFLVIPYLIFLFFYIKVSIVFNSFILKSLIITNNIYLSYNYLNNEYIKYIFAHTNTIYIIGTICFSILSVLSYLSELNLF